MTPHPEPEDLIALQEERLAAARAEEVRRHVEHCPACREAVERLRAFDQGDEEVPAVETEDGAVASWERFRERVEGDRSPSRDPARRPARHSAWWTLAAALVGALVGALLLYLALPAAEIDGLERPFWVDLVPDHAPARRGTGAGTGQEVVVPPDAGLLVVRLLLGDQTVRPGYSARLVDSRGEVVWEQQGVRRQDSGTFVLLIPRRHLAQGRYRLLLRSAGDGEEEDVVASYSFHFRETA